MEIEKLLRMYLLQIWFHLSDPATEDAMYDSYAMRKFTGINFMTESVPNETTLCKFRLTFVGGTWTEQADKLLRKDEVAQVKA